MFRKILGWFVLVILIAGSICGITFGALYFDKKESTTSETGSMEQTIDFLEKELTAIKKQRQELQESLSNTTAQRDALQLQYDAKVEELRVALVDMSTNLELISKLESQIAELESKLAEETIKAEQFEEQVTNLEESKISLQNEVTRLSGLILNLESQVAELEQELAEKTSRVSELESQVDQLEADNLALQNEVTRLTALLAGYEEIANSTLTADFYIGDTLYTTKVVKSGQAVAGLENPIDTNDYRFDGWTIDGTTPVDVATYTIEENTVFRALLTDKHEVCFVVNSEVVSTQYVVDGETATMIANPTLEGGEFKGWYVDNPEVYVDVATTVIESDITLTAYFATWKEVLSTKSTLKNNNTLTIDGMKSSDIVRITFGSIMIKCGTTMQNYVINSPNYDQPIVGAFATGQNTITELCLEGNETLDMTLLCPGLECNYSISIQFVVEDGGIKLIASATSDRTGLVYTGSFTSLKVNSVEIFG